MVDLVASIRWRLARLLKLPLPAASPVPMAGPAPRPANFPPAAIPPRIPAGASSPRRHHHQADHFPHAPDPGNPDAGQCFLYRRTIPAGRHVIRHAVQFPAEVQPGAVLTIAWYDGARPEACLGQADFPIDALCGSQDAIDVRFEVAEAMIVEVRGRVSAGLEGTHLRYFAIHADDGLAADYDFEGPYDLWPIDRIRNVIIGTTGMCNASCPHCPTNKDMLAHLRREPMSMDLFKKLIDGLAEVNLPLEGVVAFGLHGDALMDPLVVERARYVKAVLPHAPLLINTNAGPFTERRHAELVEIADIFSIHTEALSEDLFGRLMAPLRAKVVQPKIARLIEMAPRKMQITVPLSRANLGEFRQLREHWLGQGAASVVALPFGNRTVDNLDYYGYTLASVAGCCRQDVAFELVVDWNGVVMACCQDFARTNQIGDLTLETPRELLLNQARKLTFDTLRAGRWSDFSSCRNCKFDSANHVAAMAEGETPSFEPVTV